MSRSGKEKLAPIQWTPQQAQAISHDGSSVLISAAAGAGKTEVLARHCAHLIANGNPPCGINELLVVTFGKAAAGQMRERIGRIIGEMAEQQPGNKHLARQAARASTAAISTIHSFCQTVLQQHFARAGLDPQFKVMDADEAMLLKAGALENVFEELYSDTGQDGCTFRELVELYGDGDDSDLKKVVAKLSDFLGSLVCPGLWCQKARQWLETVNGQPSKQMLAAYGELLGEKFKQRMSYCAHNASRIRLLLDSPELRNLGLEEYAKLVQFADSLEKLAGKWKRLAELAEKGRLEEVAGNFGEVVIARAPTSPRSKDKPAKAKIKAIQKLFRDAAPAPSNEKLLELVALLGEQQGLWLEQSEPFGRMILELAKRLQAQYEEAKQQENRLDFADLERKALDLLNAGQADELRPSEVAKELQERFRYVLVDEYQDINPLQNAILRLVSRELQAGRQDNLFAVGDIKQSIYRFRLAEPEIFQQRLSLSREGELGRLIDLQSNFRSRPEVIRAVNLLFERLMDPELGSVVYDEHARLKAGQLGYDDIALAGARDFSGSAVEVHLLSRPSRGQTPGEAEDAESDEDQQDQGQLDQIQKEAVLIGQRIEHLMGLDGKAEPTHVADKDPQSGQMRLRPMAFGDIAILLRATSNQAEPIARVLRQMNIPVYSDAETGYFGTTEIQDTLSLLEVLDNPLQDIPLAALLRSPLGGFGETDLAQIRLSNKKAMFHDAVFEFAESPESDGQELAERLKPFLAQLQQWRKFVRDVPLAEAIWEIYQQTGYLHHVAGLPGGRARRGNLLKLHERARQFGTFARTGLRRFLQFMRDLQDRQAEAGMAPGISQAQDVVRIMSVHKSKGLEFPVVIMPRLSHQFNFSDARGNVLIDRQRYLGLGWVDRKRRVRYPTLGHQLAKHNIELHTRSEEMRLLYVALTRAREHLILVGSGSQRELEPFGSELGQGNIGGAEWPKSFELADKRSWLGWLGPALASVEANELQLAGSQTHGASAGSKATFVVSVHKPEEFGEDIFEKDRGKHHVRAGMTLGEIASLKPIKDRVEPDEGLTASLELMGQPYEYEALTSVPAAVSGTERKRLFEAGADDELDAVGQFPGQTDSADFADVQLKKTAGLSAAQIGSLNHLFMQRVDLSRPCDAADLGEQVGELARQGLFQAEYLDILDVEGAAGFFAGQLGKAMLAEPGAVYRELPFVLAIEPGELAQGVKAEGPADRPIVRGIIDLLIVRDQQATIVDFKTDRLQQADLAGRAQSYKWQMSMYARAVREILGASAVRKVLYFLRAGEMVEIDQE